MSSYEIPNELAQFILDKIESVAQLEALLLCRQDPCVDWTTDAIAKRIYVSEEQARSALVRLHSEGLLGVKPGTPNRYHYNPSSEHIETLANQLAETYAKQLVPVTNLIHSKPRTKIQQFADAFRLRKDEP